jgi:hypothetical protein
MSVTGKVEEEPFLKDPNYTAFQNSIIRRHRSGGLVASLPLSLAEFGAEITPFVETGRPDIKSCFYWLTKVGMSQVFGAGWRSRAEKSLTFANSTHDCSVEFLLAPGPAEWIAIMAV